MDAPADAADSATNTMTPALETTPATRASTANTTTPTITTPPRPTRPHHANTKRPPYLLPLRSSPAFILTTIALALFTDLFLYGLLVPILPALLRERLDLPPASPDQQHRVSWMLAAYAGTQLLVSVPVGFAADWWAAKRRGGVGGGGGGGGRAGFFLGGLLALAAASVLLAVATTWEWLVVARVLQGLSASVVWTVGLAMVVETVGPGALGRTVGTIFAVISLGDLVAPVAGGVLFEITGYSGVFWLGVGLLSVDCVMRVAVVERRSAREWEVVVEEEEEEGEGRGDGRREEGRGGGEDGHADEEEPLLLRDDLDEFAIPDGQSRVIRAMPILYCLSNARLLVALLLAFVQAALLSSFDATIPLEAEKLFGFNSLQSGLLFIAPGISYILLGPLAGWAVDRYGTKPVATLGFAYLVPTMALLRLPSDGIVHRQSHNIALFCGLLFLTGVGLAAIGSPSIVEASLVVQKYEKANPGFFGEGGGNAQLYGLNSVFYSGGLTIGPVLSGWLRDRVGYGNMNAVLAGVALTTSVLSLLYIGGPPKMLGDRTR